MVYRSRVSLTLAVLAIFGINIFHQALMFTALAGTKSKGKSWKATDSLPCTPHSGGEGMPPLSGEKAVHYLKEQGNYDSLGEAMAAARYSANWVTTTRMPNLSGGAYEADNPAQRFTSYFTPEGLTVIAAGEGKPNWVLDLKLQGIGYGTGMVESTPGIPTVANNRVELARTSSRIPYPASPSSSLTEWYVNRPEGLEQGMTLASPPGERTGDDQLRVAFKLGGNLKAREVASHQAINFCTQNGVPVVRYDKLVVTDAQEQHLAARMKLEAGQVVLEIDDSNAVYPVMIDPMLAEQVKLTASDGAADDGFGDSVAISGETVVVGADVDDIGANSDQGSVYIFVRTGQTWNFQRKLTASDGAASDLFGFSVAISGETVAIGALRDDIGAVPNQGSVYVFVRTGTTWTQQQKLTASDGGSQDTFGRVSLSGETLVIGSPFHDVGANLNQGAAYVFVRTGTVWNFQQKLTASDGLAQDQFGLAVAVSGETVVVAANVDDIGATLDQGSAYVFVRNGTTWSEQQKLTASDGAADDRLGDSVSLSGEMMVIGTIRNDSGANSNQGAAYVFVRNGTTWSEQQKLTASDGAAGDEFGSSVAVSGQTVVVGSPKAAIGANFDQGAAYVFVREGTAWSEQQKLAASDGTEDDDFGIAVATSGGTVVIGAPSDAINGNIEQGSAYVFACTATTRTWNEQAQIIAGDGAALDQFGISVAISGETVVIGANLDDVGANSNQGSAYVFVRTGMVWNFQQKLTASDGVANDQFGFSVAISGETIVIGDYRDDVGANNDQGSAYVFVRNGTTWSEQQKLTASDGASSDQFGTSVSISGETVVVGAFLDRVNTNNFQGSAYVFVRNGTTWSEQQKLTASDGNQFDQFGIAVAVSGETIVATSATDAIGGNANQGSAYVFVRNGTTWSEQQKLTASDGAEQDRFGSSVALSGETVVVGAYLDDIGANNDQGSAYVFVRNGTTWSQQQKLTASDGSADDQFGSSVAVSGETVVIGAAVDDIGANVDQGSAYVFVRNGTTWSQQQQLLDSDGDTGDTFGFVVSVSDETVVVGSHENTIGTNNDQGSAYVFVLDCEVITYPSLLFVTDTGNHRIQKFDGAAWSVVSTGGIGTAVGQFRLPEAVAADLTGTTIYVADTGNNRVQWSTDGGTTWRIFASFGAGSSQVRSPQGLALDAMGNLYVADTGNNRVVRFAGGLPGAGVILLFSGEVNGPQGLAVDSMANLFVADTGNNRVLKVPNADQPTPGATVIVARIGAGASQVRSPQGVAVDADGNLFVADTGNNRILEFVGGEPNTGVVLATIGSAIGQVRGAEGVSVNVFAAGPLTGVTVLTVADTGNNRMAGLDLSSLAGRRSGLTVEPGVGAWQLLGMPNNIGSHVGKFRSPSKIK